MIVKFNVAIAVGCRYTGNRHRYVCAGGWIKSQKREEGKNGNRMFTRSSYTNNPKSPYAFSISAHRQIVPIEDRNVQHPSAPHSVWLKLVMSSLSSSYYYYYYLNRTSRKVK